MTVVSLRRHHGTRPAAEELRRTRAHVTGPLLVEPFSARDLPAIAAHADGVLVGAGWMQDFQLLRAIGRLRMPVLLQRGTYATSDEWLAAAEYCTAEDDDQVMLCEGGSRSSTVDHLVVDLRLVSQTRAKTSRPVVVDVSSDPQLAAAAVAAGADGLFLGESVDAATVARITEQATVLAPLLRDEEPTNLVDGRAAIDRADAAIATVLEHRAKVAAAIQRIKPVGGRAGRDMTRERAIVEAMARRAPRLGSDRLAPVVQAMILAGLDAAADEEEHAAEDVAQP
ncbi:MAG: 3-deoxy-D-arabinoheptulosonate-7-phosphate synthase [Streptosporangiales bacterium]|nr:3-deoxy-D-arabinoheptulosonate-7-phosphate synthase [Streptosporangiales bacterium]